MMLLTDFDDFADIFEVLDADDSGFISIDEFVEGLNKLVSSQISFETMRMMKMLLNESIQIYEVEEICKDIHGMVSKSCDASPTGPVLLNAANHWQGKVRARTPTGHSASSLTKHMRIASSV